jgi:hypothetical protein
MRRAADADRIRRLLADLGRAATLDTTLYLVGGATAVLHGWRSTTIDVDLHIEPQSDELLRAIPALKEALEINVELASPADFIPELPGWRDRSPFVDRWGPLTVRHYDLYAQTLAKLERGHALDLTDVRELLARGLVDRRRARALFAAIEPEMYRYPAVDPRAFRRRVEAALGPDATGEEADR